MFEAPRPTGNPEINPLETVDAVARAAHLWIRTLCSAEYLHPAERQAMASGLVAGLCERLQLDPLVHSLVAYVYTMLDGQTDTALSASRLMLDDAALTSHRKAYRKGVSEASAIVEMLAYHRQVEC